MKLVSKLGNGCTFLLPKVHQGSARCRTTKVCEIRSFATKSHRHFCWDSAACSSPVSPRITGYLLEPHENLLSRLPHKNILTHLLHPNKNFLTQRLGPEWAPYFSVKDRCEGMQTGLLVHPCLRQQMGELISMNGSIPVEPRLRFAIGLVVGLDFTGL